jgi:hypothetical protein
MALVDDVVGAVSLGGPGGEAEPSAHASTVAALDEDVGDGDDEVVADGVVDDAGEAAVGVGKQRQPSVFAQAEPFGGGPGHRPSPQGALGAGAKGLFTPLGQLKAASRGDAGGAQRLIEHRRLLAGLLGLQPGQRDVEVKEPRVEQRQSRDLVLVDAVAGELQQVPEHQADAQAVVHVDPLHGAGVQKQPRLLHPRRQAQRARKADRAQFLDVEHVEQRHRALLHAATKTRPGIGLRRGLAPLVLQQPVVDGDGPQAGAVVVFDEAVGAQAAFAQRRPHRRAEVAVVDRDGATRLDRIAQQPQLQHVEGTSLAQREAGVVKYERLRRRRSGRGGQGRCCRCRRRRPRHRRQQQRGANDQQRRQPPHSAYPTTNDSSQKKPSWDAVMGTSTGMATMARGAT